MNLLLSKFHTCTYLDIDVFTSVHSSSHYSQIRYCHHAFRACAVPLLVRTPGWILPGVGSLSMSCLYIYHVRFIRALLHLRPLSVHACTYACLFLCNVALTLASILCIDALALFKFCYVLSVPTLVCVVQVWLCVCASVCSCAFHT